MLLGLSLKRQMEGLPVSGIYHSAPEIYPLWSLSLWDLTSSPLAGPAIFLGRASPLHPPCPPTPTSLSPTQN